MAVNEIRYKGVSYATDDDIKVPSGILYEVKALRSDSVFQRQGHHGLREK